MIHILPHEGIDLPRLFYTGSFLAVVFIVLLFAKRRHYPLLPCIVIFATTSLSALIGGRLLAYSPDDWRHILQTLDFPATQEKRVIGYLIFGFLGFYVSTGILKFRHGLYEILAYAWVVRLIIARVGCFLGGCCYGIPTGSEWGIAYSGSFPAYQDQLHAGLIPAGSAWSLPVHPTQLYETSAGLLILLALFLIQRKNLLRRGLSLFLVSVALYGFLRFMEEFFRAHPDSTVSLQPIHWISAGLFLILSVIIWFLESNTQQQDTIQLSPEKFQSRALLLSSGVLILIAMLIRWFSPYELLICVMLVILVTATGLGSIIRFIKERAHIRAAFLLFFSAILFSGQKAEMAEDSLKAIGNYFAVGLGGMAGCETTICGGTTEYTAGGASLSYAFRDAGNRYHQFSTEMYRIGIDNWKTFGVSPYYAFSGKWIGAGAGLNYSDFRSNARNSPMLPRFSLRIGRQDKFFFDSWYNNQFPSGLPVIQAGLGIGFSGMNEYRPSYVRFGLSDIGFYINPSINVNDQLIVDPYAIYGGLNSWQTGINLHFLIH
jgi:prolipoprotein diacylglyceryltransferase